jgi:hypothetical protein
MDLETMLRMVLEELNVIKHDRKLEEWKCDPWK